nr:unnamed protein product [Spirometra erinaceieuropaei]
MADRLMEVERLSSTTAAQISQLLTASTSGLAELKTQISQLSGTVAALQLCRSAGISRRSFSRDRRRHRSRPRTANLCWYHVNFGDKARHCVPPCSFKSSQLLRLSVLSRGLRNVLSCLPPCDRVLWSLEPPYDGPFRVLSQATKTFRIQLANREEVVSVDRLKSSVPNFPSD